MAVWRVSPLNKKSVEEHELWEKDGVAIRRITGWRTGTWLVTTNDDNEPEFERHDVPFGDSKLDAIDMNFCEDNNIEECQMEETWDGWYSDVVWPDDMDEDERNLLENIWDEDDYDGWEEAGWVHIDSEMWVWGELKVERVED